MTQKNYSLAVSMACFEDTPLGTVWAAVSLKGLAAVDYGCPGGAFQCKLEKAGFQVSKDSSSEAQEAARQLGQYLLRERRSFDIRIDWDLLAPFQRQVLQATFAIPYGATASYGDIARQVGRPRSARAVGRAEATNPMPLVIPCHRVVGSDGKLHGYGGAGGLQAKGWLLHLESGLPEVVELT
jgi:methylated-DNA-[protein]-cysteine S-methyltransferase